MASFEKDRNIVVCELIKSEVFNTIPGRKHSAFPYPQHVLHAKKRNDLLTWMVERISGHHL